MLPLRLDFVARRRMGSPVGVLLLAVGIWALGTVALDYRDAQDLLQGLQARQDRLERQARAVRVVRPPLERTGAAAAGAVAAATVAAQLALPWDALLQALEHAADPAVALLGMEAQGPSGNLRITAQTRAMADAVAFAGRLRESPLLQGATITGHEERGVGVTRLMRFSIEATWRAQP